MIRYILTALAASTLAIAAPVFERQDIIPFDVKHTHASSIVELPNGDLLACWYHGSGERTADDVVVLGARKKKGAKQWSAPFLLADTPAFPDTNPALFVDSKQRLWLIWQIIVANEWHTALTMYRLTSDWGGDAAPRWQLSEPLLVVPHNFAAKVKDVVTPMLGVEGRIGQWAKRSIERGNDKYFSRMGWMTRAHPVELPGGRIIVPLYSDGYSFSLMAITDDFGKTWRTSEPLVGGGNIQPAIARRKDGTLVTYMRDNGPPPKRLHVSESKDNGITWSPVQDTDIPNPGSGSEVTVLRDGTWALVNNDLERGRHSLPIWLSEDEGKTWKWKRQIELDNRGEGAATFHYPSIIQSRDGMIHVSYSHFLNHLKPGEPRQQIRHVRLNVEWVKQGQ